MIHGEVQTNDDELRRYSYPTVFCAVPEIGSYIKSKGGTYDKRIGKVCRITHCLRTKTIDEYGNQSDETPYVEIEITPIR